jgi:hypothetical protein
MGTSNKWGESSEVATYYSATCFTLCFVLVVEVEGLVEVELKVAVVMEEVGAILRRGLSVLCPFGGLEYCGVGAPLRSQITPTVWRPPHGRIYMTTTQKGGPKIEGLRNPRGRILRQLRCNGIVLRSRQTRFFAVQLQIRPIFQLLNLTKWSKVAGNVRFSK